MATREEKLKQCKLYKGYDENPYKLYKGDMLTLYFPRYFYAEWIWVEEGEMGIDEHDHSLLEYLKLDDDSLRREGLYPEVLAIDQTLRVLLFEQCDKCYGDIPADREVFLNSFMPKYLAIKAPPR